MIDDLDRGRPVLQDERRCRQGVEQVGKLDDQRGPGAGQIDQLQLGLDRQPESPFRADEQARQVECASTLPAAGNEVIKVVSAHPPEDLGKSAVDLIGVCRGEAGCGAVAGPFAVLLGAPGFKFVFCQRLEVDKAAVGQHRLQFENMVDGLAVEDRPCSRGVVGDHPADRGAVRGRDIGGEEQPVRPERLVQLIENTPWFDTDPALVGIDLEHAVEVLGAVENHSRPDRLPGLRRATAAGRDRHAEPCAHSHRSRDIRGIRREGDHERHDLVDAGIRGKERPVERVAPHVVGADRCGKCLSEVGRVDRRLAGLIDHGQFADTHRAGASVSRLRSRGASDASRVSPSRSHSRPRSRVSPPAANETRRVPSPPGPYAAPSITTTPAS